MKRGFPGTLLLLASIAPGALAAQAYTSISGTVTMAGSGVPEAGVMIRIERLGVGTTSMPDGRYRLVIPSGWFAPGDSVTVMASREGLGREQRTLVLHSDTSGVDFQVQPVVLAMRTIAVTRTSVAAAGQPPARTGISGAEGVCGSAEFVRGAGAEASQAAASAATEGPLHSGR